jgi:molecular chaperone GrpE (heat shock protein)
MWEILKRWTGGSDNGATVAASVPSELKRLQMELAERDAIILALQEDLTRERGAREQQLTETLDHRLENLFCQAAAPIAQFLTQAHLVDQEGKEVPLRDVVRLARRIVRVLEEAGLEVRETVGSQMPFDANQHDLLAAGQTIAAGTPVAIRFCGIAFRGRVLRKAGVAAVEA